MMRTITWIAVAVGIGAVCRIAPAEEGPAPNPPQETGDSERREEGSGPRSDRGTDEMTVPPQAPRKNGETPEDLSRRIDAALARLAKEPGLAELRRAALAEADAGQEVSAHWKRGVRVSAILPTLKLAADVSEGRDENLERYQDEPDKWGADTDRGFGADVSLQWKLDRLIFNTDELKVYDALADRAARRENLTALLVSLYYERRRLQLEWMLLPPEDIENALERRMRIEELAQTIDALTGGLLSRKMNTLNGTRP